MAATTTRAISWVTRCRRRAPASRTRSACLYGYKPDRKKLVLGMEVLESRETPGLGDKIYKDAEFVGVVSARCPSSRKSSRSRKAPRASPTRSTQLRARPSLPRRSSGSSTKLTPNGRSSCRHRAPSRLSARQSQRAPRQDMKKIATTSPTTNSSRESGAITRCSSRCSGCARCSRSPTPRSTRSRWGWRRSSCWWDRASWCRASATGSRNR